MLRQNHLQRSTVQDDDDDQEHLPIAPHVARSKRQYTSDERHPRKVHIQYNWPNASGSSARVSTPINQSMTNIFLSIL